MACILLVTGHATNQVQAVLWSNKYLVFAGGTTSGIIAQPRSIADYDYTLKTGSIDLLERNGDTFGLELEVVLYEEAKPMLVAAGFPGQP